VTRAARFRLLALAGLSVHEEVDPAKVAELVEEIRRTGIVEDPIWVAAGTGVILNGHHRFRALEQLGAHRVPAWVFDYDDPRIRLHRWDDGPPITKDEVIRRARARQPFSPKTTRHLVEIPLRPRPTPLDRLLPGEGTGRRRAARPAPTRSRPVRSLRSGAPRP
jgi:hypothetical protein